MPICPHCQIEYDGNYCPNCGARREDALLCPVCNLPVLQNDRYCRHCGMRLHRLGTKPCPLCDTPNEVSNHFCTRCGNQLISDDEYEELLGDADIVLYADKPYRRNGNTIWLGEYPASVVTDTAVINTLQTKAAPLPNSMFANKWTSYGYYIGDSAQDFMWYIDLEHDANRYRGVYFDQYRTQMTSNYSSVATSLQDNYGYRTGKPYWFRYEPLSWHVLQEKNEVALLLCDTIVDAQPFSVSRTMRQGGGRALYPNNYAYSTIRIWLHDHFAVTAFGPRQKALLQTTKVNNAVTNQFSCVDTEDQLFLLSQDEVTSGAFGFNLLNSATAASWRKSVTEYAKCQGARVNPDGNNVWWLRTPAGMGTHALYIDGQGMIEKKEVYCTELGVVPALYLKLS